ncbi:deoxyribose-phosphate aldolase [Spiroplasma alleghenense]|uniref:Deoxyribose-phosphate aldolase n=1 Tax=Spiroplasma alleghenense TaxID=216931 RepID=A0A345Z3M5_9MOLU|nr:deoxyribose-phosphate aldolase [Spiroplasma alleghenense]AXK51204.1 deoxyribose-phosphate aldolase [Spiroplasma alleghenense]
MNLNKYIDHTLLKPEATEPQIIKLCEEAKKYDFATVCVNPYWIKLAKESLTGSNVGITTVVGFPLGVNTSEVKAFETTLAIKDGATEIDMVINIGALKSQKYDVVLNDMKKVKEAAGKTIVKVIFETALLTKEEIIKACELAVEAKLDFVKTSTGFSTAGATIENVTLMKKIVNGKAKVKAAGGVRNLQDAEEMIKAGADRLGTSGGVAIIEGKTNEEY